MFIGRQFTIAKCWKQPKCPSVNEGIKKYGTFYTMEYYTAKRKMELLLHDSMDGTGEHYAKWNKPGSERQIPYDLTYKWTLVNKTNKQAKYNQRHWNKEQTESNQRGVGRRITEERKGRVIKNMYKCNRVQPIGGLQIGSCNGIQNSRCPGNIRKIYTGCPHPHKPELGEGTHGSGPFRAVLYRYSCAASLCHGHLTYL